MNELIDQVMITVKQNIPGPGTYDPKVNLDKVGIYHLSTIQYELILINLLGIQRLQIFLQEESVSEMNSSKERFSFLDQAHTNPEIT